MLLGKLATPALKVIQDGPFNTTNIEAEFLVVSAQEFVIGAKEVKFELRFGNVIDENGKERFDIVMRHNITLTTDELLTWGTDDSILLDLISAKLGFEIIEKVLTQFHYTY